MKKKNIIWIFTKNNFISLFFNPIIHCLLTLQILITIFFLKSQQELVNSETLVVLSDPYQIPTMISVIISAIFLAFLVLISISRERENGTMETLFYAPVSIREYLIGYLLGHFAIYCYCILFCFTTNLLISKILYFQLSARSVYFAVFSLPVAICCIGLGELLSCSTRNLKTAVISFLTIVILLVALQLGNTIIASAVAQNELTDLIFLRNALSGVNNFLSYFNPISCFLGITDAVIAQDWASVAINSACIIGLSVILILFSFTSLKKRGVICE